jgi:ribosomal-protein-alanine N-acetyltransferase
MSAVAIAPKPVLRPMTWDDLEEVHQNETASYEFPWSLGILRDCLRVGYLCYVYETGGPRLPPTVPAAAARGRLLGHGIMSLAAGECHLLNVCVHPDYQRRGLGQRLVEYLLEAATSRGARLALLEVRVSNQTAYRLYTRLGFDEVGIRQNYYPAHVGREDAIILARDLTV